MVLRASEVKPLAKELIYVCPDGHKSERIVFEKDLEVKTPIQCDNPKCNHKDLDIEPESSRFIDVQFVRLQELPEDLPPGQLPHYLDEFLIHTNDHNAQLSYVSMKVYL